LKSSSSNYIHPEKSFGQNSNPPKLIILTIRTKQFLVFSASVRKTLGVNQLYFHRKTVFAYESPP
jgi:hypothetical protein